MARRKPERSAPRTTRAAPNIDTLLAEKAATDPRAWEAMLNLNKMRAAQRRRDRDHTQDKADMPRGDSEPEA